MVHLIYFFYMVLNTQKYFAVHGIFHPVHMCLFFHKVFSGLFTGWITHTHTQIMSKTNILPLLITIP